MSTQHALTMAELRSAAGDLETAEVEELAAAIHAGICRNGCPLGPADEHRAAARTALAWIRKRGGRNA